MNTISSSLSGLQTSLMTHLWSLQTPKSTLASDKVKTLKELNSVIVSLNGPFLNRLWS